MTLAALYPTKKVLKASIGQPLIYRETSMYDEYKDNGVLYVVGPSEYKRVWYAQVTMQNGLITKVE